MIYFTADTHFNHSNIINHCGRPFNNVDQMNDKLIQNWNSCINNDDEIYVLGDFMFKGNGTEANNLLKRLNGIKYFIKGNHNQDFLANQRKDRNSIFSSSSEVICQSAYILLKKC
jgi:calcineurin-like phosphoesterase family protein